MTPFWHPSDSGGVRNFPFFMMTIFAVVVQAMLPALFRRRASLAPLAVVSFRAKIWSE